MGEGIPPSPSQATLPVADVTVDPMPTEESPAVSQPQVDDLSVSQAHVEELRC